MSLPAFTVEFAPAAVRDLKRLDPHVRHLVLQAATILRAAPYPGAGERIKPLVGLIPRHYRLRVGDYRIVYRIEERQVIVVRIAHRREAYR